MFVAEQSILPCHHFHSIILLDNTYYTKAQVRNGIPKTVYKLSKTILRVALPHHECFHYSLSKVCRQYYHKVVENFFARHFVSTVLKCFFSQSSQFYLVIIFIYYSARKHLLNQGKDLILLDNRIFTKLFANFV